MESTTFASDAASAAAKRKRSPSAGPASAAPAAKSAKTSGQLSINYLARQSNDDLPLITKEDTLPNLLHLLSAYSSILDRHESLASNLGARPLGPILIKRFERCFESPPKIVASHHKHATGDPGETNHSISWLEVIEFARSHPGQFTLSTFSEGKRVCQFYYPQKQLRVQISEEDFLFINSGRCQELIPPLPIWEDEEKEVGTCDVLEAKLKELTNAADMVAARTRQLSHRLKGRRAAILERRAEGGSGTPAKANAPFMTTAPPTSPAGGFVAVNSAMGKPSAESAEPSLGSSATVRNELLRHFESLPHNQGQGRSHARSHSTAGPTEGADTAQRHMDNGNGFHTEGATSNASSLSPVPTNAFANDSLPYATSGHPTSNGYGRRPSTTASTAFTNSSATLKHNFSRPLPPALESSQPFRPLCQAHMDSLPRGHRVLPPCDRCRRLRMDCVKNLTSCAGCTKKHARCHWRDVSRDELGALDHLMDTAYQGTSYHSSHNGLPSGSEYLNGGVDLDDPQNEESEDDDSNPLEDLEALGEKEEQENQIREDEEGLRNARELARAGWEDSLRSEPHDDIGQGYGSGHSDQNGKEVGQPNETPNAADEQVSNDRVDENASMLHGSTGRPSYVDDAPASIDAKVQREDEAPADDVKASTEHEFFSYNVQGGFRAVNNEITNDGGTATLN